MVLSLIIDEHRQYLADAARICAFRQAISEVVKPGAVVLDLGAGTGILGLIACRAGAKHLYSIDCGGMIELAREICKANGFQDRVTFIKALSTMVDLPEKVDVIVSDQIGYFGFDAGVLEYFNDAEKRFLKPGGALIPSRIDLCVAPVECPEICAQVDFWKSSYTDFDFGPARSIAANTSYPVKLQSEQLLGEPVSTLSLNLSSETAEFYNFEACVLATRAGTLHGIGGWFLAQLSSNVSISNSPLAEHPINRKNVFFPIDRPVELKEGDEVRILMHVVPAELMVTWKVEIWSKADTHQSAVKKAGFVHSTFRGMLISKEDLQRTRPHFIPKLSRRGEARRSVVNLCDGHRTLSDIEKAVYHSHGDLFPSLDKAAEFVAEVVTRYSL